MKLDSFIILSQSRENCELIQENDRRSPQQLELFAAPERGLHLKAKPQISTIPGICLKDPNKYQVKLGSEILGIYLTFDEAVELAKRGGR